MSRPVSFSDDLKGIFYICISSLCFAINDTAMKATSNVIPFGEGIFLRSIFGFFGLYILAISFKTLRWERALFTLPMMARTFLEALTTFLILTSLYNMPIGNVNAIIQAVPFLIIIHASLFLKEKVGLYRWGATIIGLIGVLLVIQPGTEGFNSYSLLAFVAAFAITTRDIITKSLPFHINSIMIGIVSVIVNGLLGLVLNLKGPWVWPSLELWFYLAIAGISVATAFYTGAAAMRTGSHIIVNPFRYTLLLWAFLFGYLFWGDIPNIYTWAGIILIITMGLYTLYRENLIKASSRP